LLEEAQIGLFIGDSHEHLIKVVAEAFSTPKRRIVAGNHDREVFGQQTGHRVVPQVFDQFQYLSREPKLENIEIEFLIQA